MVAEGGTMAGVKLDALAAPGAELEAGLARLRKFSAAADGLQTTIEQTRAEPWPDVTWLGARMNCLEPTIEKIAMRSKGKELCAREECFGPRTLSVVETARIF